MCSECPLSLLGQLRGDPKYTRCRGPPSVPTYMEDLEEETPRVEPGGVDEEEEVREDVQRLVREDPPLAPLRPGRGRALGVVCWRRRTGTSGPLDGTRRTTEVLAVAIHPSLPLVTGPSLQETGHPVTPTSRSVPLLQTLDVSW